MAPPTREQSWRYEKTPSGFLMRCYRNMLSRVVGIQKREAHYYQGLPLLPKRVFYWWSLADDSQFWPLFRQWVSASYEHRLTPSIDRKDARRGYTLDNMRWITQSENSSHVRPEYRRIPVMCGVDNPNALLSLAQVDEIRECRAQTQGRLWGANKLAARFNVSRQVITRVSLNRSYCR